MPKLIRIVLCLFIIYPSAIWSQDLPPVYQIKSDTAFKQEIDSTYWQVMEDKEGKWTIAEVNNPPLSNKFRNTNTKSAFADTMVYTAWVRCRLKNTMNVATKLGMLSRAGKTDFYFIKGGGSTSHFTTGWQYPYSKKDGLKNDNVIPFTLLPGEEVLIYMRKHNTVKFVVPTHHKIELYNAVQLNEKALDLYQVNYIQTSSVYESLISGLLLLAAIFNFLIYHETKDRVNLFFSLFLFFLFIWYNPVFSSLLPRESQTLTTVFEMISPLIIVFLLFFIRHYFQLFRHYPRWDKLLLTATTIFVCFLFVFKLVNPSSGHWLNTARDVVAGIYAVTTLITMLVVVIIAVRNRNKQGKIFLIAILPLLGFMIFSLVMSYITRDAPSTQLWQKVNNYTSGLAVVWAVVVFSRYLFKEYGQQQRQLLQLQIEKEREQAEFVAKQKVELEKQVVERTEELQKSLANLKAAQSLLIQSEKMASLGELTAGVAHEIQNPLNFVNNFSEVSQELVGEMKHELKEGNVDEAIVISDNLENNLQKINHHGKRADAIVKGMLLHSRASAGKKERTDINALADEYLRLSYHGLKAKDKDFNANFTTDLDKSIGQIEVVPQDIGRVLLNLYNNAFYAVNEKKKQLNGTFEPTLEVSTKRVGDKVELSVKDNGTGIPKKVIDKIYQPFFTTKPTGQGTGLGLSLSYDIIKAHGGELKVETKEGEYAEFTIQLPA